MITTQIQIKTGDYEYIMQDIEVESPKEAVAAFKELKKAYYLGGAIPDKDFNAIYDTLRLKRKLTGDPGLIHDMSLAQQFALNELKKSLKRVVPTDKVISVEGSNVPDGDGIIGNH